MLEKQRIERAKVEDKAKRIRAVVAQERGVTLEEYEAILDGGIRTPGTTILLPDDSEFDVADISKTLNAGVPSE